MRCSAVMAASCTLLVLLLATAHSLELGLEDNFGNQDQDQVQAELGQITSLDSAGKLLESLNNLFQESLQLQREAVGLQKESGDSLAALRDLPSEVCKCRDKGYQNYTITSTKQPPGLNYIDKLTQENRDLRSKFEDKLKQVTDLEERLVAADLESKANLLKVTEALANLVTERNNNHDLSLKIVALQHRLELEQRNSGDCQEKLAVVEARLKEPRVTDDSSKGNGGGKKPLVDVAVDISDIDRDPPVKVGKEVLESCPLTEGAEEVRVEMQKYNKTKDWTPLRKLLEGLIDHDSAAFKQLQAIGWGDPYPMYYIGLRGNTELAHILITCGQLPDIADKNGHTILHGAAHVGDVWLAKWMVAQGASTETKDYLGWTPLIREAYSGHLDLIKYLVSVGANTRARGKDNRNALEVARGTGRAEIVAFLSKLPH